MAQIRARGQADGFTRYTAIIRIRKGRALIQPEYRTFAQRSAAASWAKHREVHLENQAVAGRRQTTPLRWQRSSAGTSRPSRRFPNGSEANRVISSSSSTTRLAK